MEDSAVRLRAEAVRRRLKKSYRERLERWQKLREDTKLLEAEIEALLRTLNGDTD